MSTTTQQPNAETIRLEEDAKREKNWKRWGPYLSDRQWGTVREDYSPDGSCWEYFPHDHARSRAYRWGEDGLFGITDRECRLCLALALWNGRDPILKERLFGLTNAEGNHGEDVKECYFYLDSTPTHSYMKALYKYPQAAFPYDLLVAENRGRGRDQPEFELVDTGVFEGGRYFDVFVEYAKAAPDDILIRITIANRAATAATLHLLPTLWFRNTWSWGCKHDGCWPRPYFKGESDSSIVACHATLPLMRWRIGPDPDGVRPEMLFTENETNVARFTGGGGPQPFAKDGLHECVVNGKRALVSREPRGTKAAACYRLQIPARKEVAVRLRLSAVEASSPASPNRPGDPLGVAFEQIFTQRIREADEFYAARIPSELTTDERRVARQAYAGLLWSKQFYHYVVQDWLAGDPNMPAPPASRLQGRNHDWPNLFNRDVISMPDKWEYPWYAAWDLAFHMLPFARIDPQFAKDQLVLFLREWYMHPNGQLPAYEFALDDVNPPVHAWACWRVYKLAAARGLRDRLFLERVFVKLLINFTWWINRKDMDDDNLFSGGFLGLDNIGVFDRSRPLPSGGTIEQADGTAWMAFYCATMLSMALELAVENRAYGDIASKFFEHFVAIADAMNTFGGTGLWDEEDGFYYDRVSIGSDDTPLRVRSLVGILPIIAVEVLDRKRIDQLPGFRKRLQWFLSNRRDLAHQISYMLEDRPAESCARYLLAIPSRKRLERVLRYLLDENELLSPYGVRSLSRAHRDRPYEFHAGGLTYSVRYEPGDSTSTMFGGNSNWRGPVWFPINYLLIEALERYDYFYGDALRVECPTGSGRLMNLRQVAQELATRLCSLFLPDSAGHRACNGGDSRYATDPHWRGLLLFNEYFHGDNGQGLGASHQTGWTALITRCLEDLAAQRRDRTEG
jgi:hypothetical protein